MNKILHNEQGAALVSAVGFVLIIGTMVIVYFRVGGYESQLVGVKMNATQALYCADSGIAWAINGLQTIGNWTTWENMNDNPMNPGESSLPVGALGEFAVTFIVTQSPLRGTLTSVGTYNGISRTVVSQVYPEANLPWEGIGALTGPTKLNGNMTVDGRNHLWDASYTMESNTGTRALVTEAAYVDLDVKNNPNFGGTDTSGTDYPAGPGDALYEWADLVTNDAVRNAIMRFGEVIPDTPDQVYEQILGVAVPEGTLRNLALTNSALYTSNPGSGDFQLKADVFPYVNYIELPEGDIWNNATFLPPDNGKPVILVVHNATTDSVLKNMNGLIPGLIILDKVWIMKETMLGALVTLSDADMHLGNAGSQMLYCRDCLTPLVQGNPTGTWSVQVVSWNEAVE